DGSACGGEATESRWIPATACGCSCARRETMPAPRSPPWATYRSNPRDSVMSRCKSSCVCGSSEGVGAENGNPGSAGTMTVTELLPLSPKRDGSDKRRAISTSSNAELGQPLTARIGVPPGRSASNRRYAIAVPSKVTLLQGRAVMAACWTYQSNPVVQY